MGQGAGETSSLGSTNTASGGGVHSEDVSGGRHRQHHHHVRPLRRPRERHRIRVLTDPVEVLQAEVNGRRSCRLGGGTEGSCLGSMGGRLGGLRSCTQPSTRHWSFGPPQPGLPLAWFGVFDERVPIEPVGIRSVGPAQYTVSSWSPSIGLSRYEDGVRTIRRHIAEGDTYQVNYTFRLAASFAGSALGLYRDMSVSQRGAYGAFLDTGRFHVASAHRRSCSTGAAAATSPPSR